MEGLKFHKKLIDDLGKQARTNLTMTWDIKQSDYSYSDVRGNEVEAVNGLLK